MRARIVWVDLVKVVAIFSVLVLHASSVVVNKLSTVDIGRWNIANTYDAFTRMSVPLFFMLSGALLLAQKEEALHAFFLKRFSKVIIPLMGFSIIYIFFVKYALHNNIDIVQHLFEALYQKQYYHLWFLYTLLGLYLFIPILKVFIKNSSLKLQVYFLLLWFVTVSLIPLINTFSSLHIPVYMPMMGGYIGYLVLGYLLSKYSVEKKVFYTALVCILISSLLTAYGTYILSVNANHFKAFFYSNLSINVIVQAISYFIVLKYVGERVLEQSFMRQYIILPLSLSSFGIYLIHPIFLWVLHTEKIGLYALNGLPIVFMIPLTALVTLLLSYMSVYLMKKIPLIEKLVP